MARAKAENRRFGVPSYSLPQHLELLWPSAIPKTVRALILIAGTVLLLTLSAKIKVPFYPVPMTLQTLTIGIAAATLGSRLSVISVAVYLASGMIGLPVFANTPPSIAGLAYFTGPTAGYLAGFLVAAALVGYLCERGWARSFGTLWLAMIAGDLIILRLGVSWLAWGKMLLGSGLPIGISKAMALGVYPFILGALLKELLGATIVYGSSKRLLAGGSG